MEESCFSLKIPLINKRVTQLVSGFSELTIYSEISLIRAFESLFSALYFNQILQTYKENEVKRKPETGKWLLLS